MATIPIDVPDDMLPRVHSAFGKSFDADRVEGESDEQLTVRKLGEILREVVKGVEGQEAAEAARTAKVDEVDAAFNGDK